VLPPCLGREGERAAVAAALARSRLVCLVGPPGSGKTLLARHVTGDDAVAWVDARGLDHDALVAAGLDALGAEPAPGDSADGTLARALEAHRGLLVLDGIDPGTGAETTVRMLVERAPEGRLLATTISTAPHPHAHVVRVGPLRVPRDDEPLTGPAVDLFRARHEAAGGHPLDLAADGGDVRRLLEATGGLPLLIEQVASQAALVGLANARPAASLTEALDAAYALLDPAGQQAYRRLGRLGHPVGMDVLAAASDLSREDATAVVTALAGRNLVEVLPDGRLDMLSPVRGHASRLASDDDAARALSGLLGWADDVAPDDVNSGAADAPWLADLPAMRRAVLWGCGDDGTRDRAYSVANRIFSSLYTSMRAREAVEILEGVVASGDGPPAIGAQVARRAGIAASEVRGSYEGMWLLDRADEHAGAAADPDDERSKTASIRAEMHLDAGDLARAEEWALRAVDLGRRSSGSIIRQATRTLADVCVSAGRFADATRHAHEAMPTSDANDEAWIALSLRTLLARIALEQGRIAEAVAATRAVVADAQAVAEDRVGLLAQTLLRDLDRSWTAPHVDRETLPWAIRLPVLAQDARDLFAVGDVRRAAGLAADVVALADSARLGRDAVEGRLLLGRALLADGDDEQAASTFLTAAEQAAGMPMPLRVADALDGLASVAQRTGLREHRLLAAAAAGLRAPRHAAAWGYAERFAIPRARTAPDAWIADGALTRSGLRAVSALFNGGSPAAPSPLAALTAAERQVADRVADGLTSRQIAEDLFVSPRTVDAHLTHIYRKLDINTRARLAAIVADHR